MSRQAIAIAVLAVLLAGCGALPRSSASLDDPALQQHVQDQVCRLTTPCGDVEVVLVDSHSVQAELLDDGRLAVRLGLLLAIEEDAELLFVLAHELAHRALGHTPPATLAERLPLELAADAEAVRRLTELGYPQDAGYRLIDRLRTVHGFEQAPADVRAQIARRLQALPRSTRTRPIDRAPALQALLLRYRTNR